MNEREQIEAAIAAQEGLRGTVDDAVVDLTVSALRAQLATLAPTADQDRRRRQATVLFADVQGFTALSERLDAEEVGDVMEDVWDRLDRVIVEHGGRIDKHIGDAVMGLWGADSSREDDPEQAVRAALGLQEAMAQLGAEELGALVMRVGVSTGTVVLGEVATTREFTAMGDTVNVAARLESAAPPGGVLVSHDTYRHVRGVFDVQQLEPLALKGKAQPIVAYRVLRAKPHTFRMATRGVEGVETRLVGRTAELAALQSAFDQVVAAGRLSAVAVVGDAGVGKSRLLYELENWIELLATAVFFLKARATATRQAVPLGLFRDLVAARFGVLDSDSAADVGHKLRDGFAPHLDADEAELVGHWLGFDLSASHAVGRLRGSAGFEATCLAHFAGWLRRLATGDPVLVVLEDLHWADPDSLALLAALVERLRDVPVLVVAASRPPVTAVVEEVATVLRVEPLRSEDAGALVDDVLRHVPEVPDELRSLVTERADGNPFFVEELIKMLIDDGVVEPGEPGEPWSVDVRGLDADSVPSTLTGVLESRLDSLVPGHRAAVQHASVIGRIFWDAAVEALDPAVPSPDVASALDAACSRELVYRRDRSAIGGSAEFIFKHALLRDVTYETVLLRDRRRLHAMAAEWLSAHSGERRNEFLEQIAGHHQLAGQPADAAELFALAGDIALGAERSAMAARAYGTAAQLWAEAGMLEPIDVVLRHARACNQAGDLEQTDRLVAALFDAELSPQQECEALYIASWSAADRADHALERELLDRALPMAEEVGGITLLRVLLGVAWHAVERGDLEVAEAAMERAAAIDVGGPPPREARRLLSLRSWAASMRGDQATAEAIIHSALAAARASGDLEEETVLVGNLGVVRHLVGDATGSMEAYAEAEGCYQRELAASSRLGLEHARARCLSNLAQVSVRLGSPDDARQYLAEAMSMVLASGRLALLPLCLAIVADLRLADGDVDGALLLLGAIAAAPSSSENDRQEVDRFLDRVTLDPEVIEAGLAAGAGLDVESLGDQALAELQPPTP